MLQDHNRIFSSGSSIQTRKLQTHIDFDSEHVLTTAEQTNLITGDVVLMAVETSKKKNKIEKQVPGQLNIDVSEEK